MARRSCRCSGEVMLPAVCYFFCDNLGSSQILTKYLEFLLLTALQFDKASLFLDVLWRSASPDALRRGDGCPGRPKFSHRARLH